MNKTGKRADSVMVTGIKNPRDSFGRFVFYNDETRLRKEIERYTVTCEECEGTGRYDERGEITCEDCGLVLSDKGDGKTMYQMYADKYSGQGGANQASHGNRGASGNPHMRPPALRDPGPSGDDSAGGAS